MRFRQLEPVSGGATMAYADSLQRLIIGSMKKAPFQALLPIVIRFLFTLAAF
jgi:hypothetical protein